MSNCYNSLLKLCTGVFLFILVQTIDASPGSLTVYSTEGFQAPLEEINRNFLANENIKIINVSGTIEEWIQQAKKEGDIIICGAQYQLSQLEKAFPKLIQPSSRTSLFSRASGVLIRKGNPKKITTFWDLSHEGTGIMVVDGTDQLGLWEDMSIVRGVTEKIRGNIIASVSSNTQAMHLWNTNPDIDAWITLESWYLLLKDQSRLLKVHEQYRRYRSSAAALLSTSTNALVAQKYIKLLQSDQSHKIFIKWGWHIAKQSK